MRKLKITELNRLTPEAFKDSKKIPLVVVLDHVRSLNNVGSVPPAVKATAWAACWRPSSPAYPQALANRGLTVWKANWLT